MKAKRLFNVGSAHISQRLDQNGAMIFAGGIHPKDNGTAQRTGRIGTVGLFMNGHLC